MLLFLTVAAVAMLNAGAASLGGIPSLESVCGSVDGGCPEFSSIDAPKGVEGRSYVGSYIALIELSKEKYSRDEWESAEYRLKSYINGNNLAGATLPAMFPIQQLTTYEVGGVQVKYNAIAVSFPAGTSSLPLPRDQGIQVHQNGNVKAYVRVFGGFLPTSQQADAYQNHLDQLAADLEAAGVKFDRNAQVSMEYGIRYNPFEGRREVGYLTHLAIQPKALTASRDEACKAAPGGCISYSDIPVESDSIEGRSFDSYVLALVRLSSNPFDQADYESARDRIVRYLNGGNVAGANIPALYPFQQLVTYYGDAVKDNWLAVALPEGVKSVPLPNDSGIDFHVTYKSEVYVKAFGGNVSPSDYASVYKKNLDELSDELSSLGVDVDSRCIVMLDYGDRFDAQEVRREVGYLVHLA